ncbi:MAG: hypothetical protein F4Z01_00525 [Gammaproteobacteria bacterium]|nr:hypothetical protein [Gammaproteobacteria bacterium]MYF38190.1 hypothetical protein [Gammaproteobacteria bacterium]
MTVIMDVWNCLDEDIANQRRGTVEQRRLHDLRRKAPKICAHIDDFAINIFYGQAGFRHIDDELSLDQLLIRQAEALIPTTIKECSHGTLVDDRPIYWGRLFTQYFFSWFNRASVPRDVRTELCAIHETTSRHYANKAARTAPTDEPRVLLTAFDPFLLNSNIKQSNPSTSVALTLAEMYGDSVPIEVFIFPVRYRDFNKGIVERVLKPRFEREPLFVLTLSMGRDSFELERFVGRRRSTPALDNLDYTPVKNGKNPPCLTKCPEFLEFTLPTEILLDIQGPWNVRDNRVVATRSRGEFEANSLDELAGEVCVRGSGGGFLSNEIAYRTRLLQLNMGKSFPLGHLHLPRISQFWPAEMCKMVNQTSEVFDRLREYVD